MPGGTDPFTASARLCDDAGLISDERVPSGSPGTAFDLELTYRRLLNNLRAHAGLPPYEGPALPCTGSAHLAREHFRCTGPAHQPKPWAPTWVYTSPDIAPPVQLVGTRHCPCCTYAQTGAALRDRIYTAGPVRLSRPQPTQEEVQIR